MGIVSKAPGEFELIARLTAKLRQSDRTILGPGDDCAILAPSRGSQLITIDSMVEGVHFKLGWGTPERLGARAYKTYRIYGKKLAATGDALAAQTLDTNAAIKLAPQVSSA